MTYFPSKKHNSKESPKFLENRFTYVSHQNAWRSCPGRCFAGLASPFCSASHFMRRHTLKTKGTSNSNEFLADISFEWHFVSNVKQRTKYKQKAVFTLVLLKEVPVFSLWRDLLTWKNAIIFLWKNFSYFSTRVKINVRKRRNKKKQGYIFVTDEWFGECLN